MQLFVKYSESENVMTILAAFIGLALLEQGYASSVGHRVRSDCESLETPWSQCSKSCDLGISTRLTNRNKDCSMRRETRLCYLRPCRESRFLPKVCK